MSNINEIVQVTITKETTAIARAAFGIPAIIAEFLSSDVKVGATAFTERTRSYNSLSAVGVDFDTTTRIYKAAAAMFSQPVRPSKIIIGRKDPVADATWAAGLNAIAAEDDTWYLFMATDINAQLTEVLQGDVAAWALSSGRKIFVVQSTDTDALASGTVAGSLVGELKAENNSRTAIIYHAAAKETECADAAWIGNCAPFEPGSQTWAYKTLSGVSADALTSTQEGILEANNANRYTSVAGVSITRNGKVSSGEYIDIQIGIDWLNARLAENVYSLLVNSRKVPYDDTGIQLVVGQVESTLNGAARLGILQAGTIVVTAPLYSEIPQADKLARNLPDVKFTALLLGAVHTVEIQGTVSL